jgi:tetratricopeptide (TPR) repeat protein
MTIAQEAEAALGLAKAGNLDQAWVFFRSRTDLALDRDSSFAFAELLALDPGRGDVLPTAERIATTFARDPELMIALTASLLRVAEQKPADEPPFEQGAAHLAAGIAQRCFEALPGELRTTPEIGGYLQINLADALRMMGPTFDADAHQAYQLALTIDDTNGWWWFQLGLLHKWRGRFTEGLEANEKARARLGDLKPVLWNLAICATALGRGELAVEAWRKLGIESQPSSSGLPYVADMPPMQVRVATLGEETGQNDPLPASAVTFEVVWVQPLSPCHGVVQSPTARRASVDYGDVVLWDGAPVRIGEIEGRQVPVFPLLWILRRGEERRLRFVGMAKDAQAIDAVAGALPEDVHMIVFDRRRDAVGATLFYGKLIAPAGRDLTSVRDALDRAVRSQPSFTLAIPQLYELLGDTPQAGKAHQAWGGIEKAAESKGILRRG